MLASLCCLFVRACLFSNSFYSRAYFFSKSFYAFSAASRILASRASSCYICAYLASSAFKRASWANFSRFSFSSLTFSDSSFCFFSSSFDLRSASLAYFSISCCYLIFNKFSASTSFYYLAWSRYCKASNFCWRVTIFSFKPWTLIPRPFKSV